MQRLHDERSFASLRLEIGATDDPVAPEERQDVVAELALRRRLVDLDQMVEAEGTPRERAVPEEVVERGEEDSRSRARRVEAYSRADEHVCRAVLDAYAFEDAVGDERIRMRADPRGSAAKPPVLGHSALRQRAACSHGPYGQLAVAGRLVG